MARNDRKKQIIEYKAVGHTSKETAEHFGISPDYVRRICSGVSPQLNNNDESTVAVRIKEKTNGRFKYISGYKNKDSNIRVMCLKCGEEFERTYHHLTTHFRGCPICKAKERKHKRDLSNRIKSSEKAMRAFEKKGRTKYKQIHMRACSECGGMYVAKSINNVTCSEECSRHRINRRKDKRISKDKQIERIDLGTLYARDNGVCHLCGGLCDWNDEPNKVNSKYPSIDHIIPISCGGEDSYDNVKLAHWYCNTARGNAPVKNF